MRETISKYGLLTYLGTPKYNVGDYVQSLAAKQFLPKVDQYINRDHLSDYEGEEVKMIMNGWYMHKPKNFRPKKNIKPLYISFHLNSRVKNEILNDHENVTFLKNNSPIGCRDYFTLEALKSKGIEAYFSSCLTTTLNLKYKSEKRTNNIYFADPVWILPNKKKLLYGPSYFIKGILKGEVLNLKKRIKVLKQVFDSEIIDTKIDIDHMLPGKHKEERRFLEAEIFLKKLSEAKIVITSRIHAALPCLAMGTPVIFVNYGFDKLSDQSRFRGIVDFFNIVNIDENGKISANFELDKGKITMDLLSTIKNPKKHLNFTEDLIVKCQEFVNED